MMLSMNSIDMCGGGGSSDDNHLPSWFVAATVDESPQWINKPYEHFFGREILTKKSVADQINIGTEKSGKVYAFNENHERTRPAQMWFQESDEGLILFVVFYSQACRWSRCLGCNLPSMMSRNHVPYTYLVKQIDSLFALPEVKARAGEIKKLIVSNNGSVLDEDTFSSTALMYLMVRINLFLPVLSVLSLETRAEYVDTAELEFLARALREGKTVTDLELSIGFEAFDEHVRNTVFDKGLTLEVFEKLVTRIAPYGYRLKCYFMLKPVPDMSDEAAVEDIISAIDYLSDIAVKTGVRINMHLNPTYAAKGTPLEQALRDGHFSPPRLSHLSRAALHARDKKISIFLGLSDEGLAISGGSFLRPGEEAQLARLQEFNRTQDYGLLAMAESDT